MMACMDYLKLKWNGDLGIQVTESQWQSAIQKLFNQQLILDFIECVCVCVYCQLIHVGHVIQCRLYPLAISELVDDKAVTIPFMNLQQVQWFLTFSDSKHVSLGILPYFFLIE